MLRLLLSVLLLHTGIAVSAQTTYFVDAARPNNAGAGTSWATAKRDLQVAINGASANDQVWVKAGTYLPTHDPFGSTAPSDNRDKTFTLKNGVKVYGGFAGTETLLSQRNWQTNGTILSGDIGTANVLADNAYHVVITVGLNAATVLDGVTVTKGYATATFQASVTVNTFVLMRYHGAGIYNSNSATTFANCTIKDNAADCTNSNGDAWGAGMVNHTCTSSFTNCTFDGNYFLNAGVSYSVFGAGMNIIGGSCTLTNCAFINNTSGGNFLGGSSGGAIYASSGATSIVNTVFYNNAAMNGAAISVVGANNLTSATNCTFAGNTSWYAGTAYSGFCKGTFRNCIFWNNVPTINLVAGRNEILSQETNVANQPTFINCIVRDGTGSPLSVMNTVMTNCSNATPQFTNLADGDGADNVIMTADDGLRLACGSPAINGGTGTTPTTDVLNLLRIGALDIGAYEGGHNAAAFNTIPSANTTIQLPQNATGVTHYSDCTNKLLEIQSGGTYTLSGTVTTKVWIDAAQSLSFVKRHYEITPQTNASTATGRVTLYFRQQEFNDFNAVNALQLPTGPSDATGIANIKIEKKAGSSSNGTGHPDSYSGSSQTISGAALSILWNATAARWEISFDVTGFSGFFLKTQTTVLPLRLISFSGKPAATGNELLWETANEVNTKTFELQRSTDGRTFSTIGAQAAVGIGNNRYQYNDHTFASGTAYYRLKMIDKDEQFAYSKVVLIDRNTGLEVVLYPNPARESLTIASGNTSLLNTTLRVIDQNGRMVTSTMIRQFPYLLNIGKLPAGVYYLQFQDGTARSFVKQ